MHQTHNERVKFTATLANNIALSLIVAGFVAPMVTGQLQGGWHALATIAWIVMGLSLHLMAIAMLGRLR